MAGLASSVYWMRKVTVYHSDGVVSTSLRSAPCQLYLSDFGILLWLPYFCVQFSQLMPLQLLWDPVRGILPFLPSSFPSDIMCKSYTVVALGICQPFLLFLAATMCRYAIRYVPSLLAPSNCSVACKRAPLRRHTRSFFQVLFVDGSINMSLFVLASSTGVHKSPAHGSLKQNTDEIFKNFATRALLRMCDTTVLHPLP